MLIFKGRHSLNWCEREEVSDAFFLDNSFDTGVQEHLYKVCSGVLKFDNDYFGVFDDEDEIMRCITLEDIRKLLKLGVKIIGLTISSKNEVIANFDEVLEYRKPTFLKLRLMGHDVSLKPNGDIVLKRLAGITYSVENGTKYINFKIPDGIDILDETWFMGENITLEALAGLKIYARDFKVPKSVRKVLSYPPVCIDELDLSNTNIDILGYCIFYGMNRCRLTDFITAIPRNFLINSSAECDFIMPDSLCIIPENSIRSKRKDMVLRLPKNLVYLTKQNSNFLVEKIIIPEDVANSMTNLDFVVRRGALNAKKLKTIVIESSNELSRYTINSTLDTLMCIFSLGTFEGIEVIESINGVSRRVL